MIDRILAARPASPVATALINQPLTEIRVSVIFRVYLRSFDVKIEKKEKF